MTTIAFHSNQISLQGTEVALYDYAHFNETLLGNQSLIVYDQNNPNNSPAALPKFQNRFTVVGYQSRSELDVLLKHHGVDALYAIKSGKRDGLVSAVVPTMVHAVFPTDPRQAHGSAYAYISEWLSWHCSRNQVACVPHIVHLPQVDGDLRAELGIPEDAFVVGGYGGAGSFNIPAAISGLKQALNQRADLDAVFLNITPFMQHERVHFLPGSPDMERKVRLIHTCDAMLHGRKLGESFGLACGEFSICNKPVITYRYGKHTHHMDVLGKRGFYYTDAASLADIIGRMSRKQLQAQNWDCYSARYNPATVMERFEQHLIHPALAQGMKPVRVAVGWQDRLHYLKFKLSMRQPFAFLKEPTR
jgi:glycosyltransferase involved in cell wall biosynthesis